MNHFTMDNLLNMKQKSKYLAILEIIVGLVFLTLPNFTINTIVGGIGIIFIIIGLISSLVIFKFSNGIFSKLIFIPIFIFLFGLFTVLMPGKTIVIIIIAIGIGSVVKGIFSLAFSSKYFAKSEFKYSGIISILFGIILIMLSANGGKVFAYVIAFNFLFHGAIELLNLKAIEDLIKTTTDDSIVDIK